MKTINLLLADDHTIIRDGIKLMLKKNPEFNIVAEANNGEEAISYLLAKPNTVDVILMDINMPEMNGIEATQYITNNIKGLNILALTMHAEETYITSMLRAGALGYILKEAGTSELMSAIKSVASGQKYYSNEVSVTMINALMNNDSPKSSVLSKRESEVLGHIAMGTTNKKVREILFISGRTVETHRRNILDKLDLKNTAELIRYAIENKVVSC